MAAAKCISQTPKTLAMTALPDLKVLSIFWFLKVDQCRKQQDHISPFIHNRCPAVSTADFAGQLVYACLL